MKARRAPVIGAAAMTVGIGLVAAPWATPSTEPATAQAEEEPTPTATVARGDLETEREFNATISFGDPWTVTTDAAGIITSRHEAGAVVGNGEELIRVDDKPVFLAQGAMPMYRELAKVDTRVRDQNGDRLRLISGYDVAQLQYFLTEAGFDADGALEVDGTFGATTEQAVEEWQEAVGLPATGRVDSSQIVFAPEPVRIETSARVGEPFTALDVTNPTAAVLVDTSNRDRSAFSIDAIVDVAITGGEDLRGRVEKQEQVTAADGSTIWRTSIRVDEGIAATTTTATVTVRSTVATDALIVPVSALLGLAEGGFAVEVVDGAGSTRLVGVVVGEVLDGRAEIDGSLHEGDDVVIAP